MNLGEACYASAKIYIHLSGCASGKPYTSGRSNTTMGFLDTIESMAGQGGQSQNAQVAGGLMQELQQHPGGIGSVMDSFRQNGMDQHVNSWATGANQSATPEQIQTGLGGTGLIDKVAARVGVSPQIATMALATALPMVIQHFTNEQGQPLPQSNYGGLASTVLSKFL